MRSGMFAFPSSSYTGPCAAAGFTSGCCTGRRCHVSAGNCWCDAACHRYHNCCPDIDAIGCTECKSVGTNAVKVLATLFLLSFTKLQRTVIAILSFTYITLPYGSKKYVWLYDGNVDYGEGKHIPLLVAAVAILLMLSIPYVLMLLLIQCLRSVSSSQVCSWVPRLTPLLDAYAGPYKFKYPFWTGFLLLVRSALFLVFAFNYVVEPSLNLMAIVIASLFVLTLACSLGGVYRKWPLDILESSFILNLGVSAAATLYIKFQHRNQAAVFYTSTGVSLRRIPSCSVDAGSVLALPRGP